MEIYAAIDLGTNACRLTIARTNRGKVRILDTFSRVIQFGENLNTTGILSQKAIERAIRALKECAKKISEYEVTKSMYVATEACRSAQNSQYFLDLVKEETGLDLIIISSKDEIYFSTTACIELMDKYYPFGVVFDIGGGSTEISWFRFVPNRSSIEIIDYISIPFGFMTIADPDIASLKAEKKIQIYADIYEFYNRNNIAYYIAKSEVQMIGVSGTINSLVNILLEMSVYNRQVVNGFLMRIEDINYMIDYVSSDEYAKTFGYSSIAVRQKHKFLLDSSIIFRAIHEIFYLPITVADRGVRDGIMAHMIKT